MMQETHPIGYTVEQGPKWLVDFYLQPPAWVNPALKVLGVVVAGIVAYRLYQRGGEIPLGQQHAMLQIAATVIAVMTGVLAMANYTAQPYAVDVSVGFGVGYALVTTLATVDLPVPLEDARDRISLGWGLLAVGAFVLPMLANAHGRGMLLGTAQWYIVILSLVMVWYNQFAVGSVLSTTEMAQ